MYSLSRPEVIRILDELQRKGVRIRIILDKSQNDRMDSSLFKLAGLGLNVTTNNFKNKLMHHKFVVIDDRVLMNGSLNFTTQAVSRNDENLVVTRSRRIVAAFSNKFDALWAEYCGNQIDQGLA